jgi:hypothetical protein
MRYKGFSVGSILGSEYFDHKLIGLANNIQVALIEAPLKKLIVQLDISLCRSEVHCNEIYILRITLSPAVRAPKFNRRIFSLSSLKTRNIKLQLRHVVVEGQVGLNTTRNKHDCSLKEHLLVWQFEYSLHLVQKNFVKYSTSRQ